MALELLTGYFVKSLRMEYRVTIKLGDGIILKLFEIGNGCIIELAT
jgi:hypothetical protein